jgi:hypothetical protein
MKKMLLLVAVFAFGTMAFAAVPTHVDFQVGCAAFHGVRTGVPKKFLEGFIDRSSCPGNNINMGGFQHGNPKTIAPNATPVDDFSLPFYGLYGYNYSLNYLVTEKNDCVFASYVGNGYGLYLLNSGPCTRIGPPAAKVNRGNPAKPNRDSKKMPTVSGQ